MIFFLSMLHNINLVFSPMYLTDINPVWSLIISLFNTLLILFAMQPEPIL